MTKSDKAHGRNQQHIDEDATTNSNSIDICRMPLNKNKRVKTSLCANDSRESNSCSRHNIISICNNNKWNNSNNHKMTCPLGDQGDTHEGFVGKDNEDAVESTLHELCDYFDNKNLREKILRGICDYAEKSSTIKPRVNTSCVGKEGIIAQGHSDAGKYVMCSVDILQQIDTSICDCQILIITPTRKLAPEIQRLVIKNGEGTKVHSHVSTGGTNIRMDVSIVKAGCHIVVGTPGRVNDLINRKALCTSNIKFFVLDEEFKMYPDFKEQIQYVFSKLPTDVQVILLSTTMPRDNSKITGRDGKKKSSSQKTKKSQNLYNWSLENDLLGDVGITRIEGHKFIYIKDYREKNDKYIPRRGVLLSVGQWKKLVMLTDEINLAIEQA